MSAHPVRPDVVQALLAVMTDASLGTEDRVDAVMRSDATDEERNYALGLLAGLAAKEADAADANLKAAGFPRTRTTPNLLDATYRDLQRVVAHSAGIAFVLDRLAPVWASRPDTPLIDVIKIARPDALAQLAEVLHNVGLHDLDEVLADDGPTT
jgi:hypothetical protein